MRPLKIMAKGPTMGLLGLRGLSVSNDCIQCGWSAKKVLFCLERGGPFNLLGERKKKTPHLYRLHICLLIYLWILPSITLKRWAAHTFIDTLTFSFCSVFAKISSFPFKEFHKREFCLLWNYIVPHDSKLCWSGFEFQSGDFWKVLNKTKMVVV